MTNDWVDDDFKARGIAVKHSVKGRTSVMTIVSEVAFWREDLSGFIPRELIDAAVSPAKTRTSGRRNGRKGHRP